MVADVCAPAARSATVAAGCKSFSGVTLLSDLDSLILLCLNQISIETQIVSKDKLNKSLISISDIINNTSHIYATAVKRQCLVLQCDVQALEFVAASDMDCNFVKCRNIHLLLQRNPTYCICKTGECVVSY